MMGLTVVNLGLLLLLSCTAASFSVAVVKVENGNIPASTYIGSETLLKSPTLDSTKSSERSTIISHGMSTRLNVVPQTRKHSAIPKHSTASSNTPKRFPSNTLTHPIVNSITSKRSNLVSDATRLSTIGSHTVNLSVDDQMFPTSRIESEAIRNDDFTGKLIDTLASKGEKNSETERPPDELQREYSKEERSGESEEEVNRHHNNNGDNGYEDGGNHNKHNGDDNDDDHEYKSHDSNHHNRKHKEKQSPNWDTINPEDLNYHPESVDHDRYNFDRDTEKALDGEGSYHKNYGDNKDDHENYGDEDNKEHDEKEHHMKENEHNSAHSPSKVFHEVNEELRQYNLQDPAVKMNLLDERDMSNKRSSVKSFGEMNDALMEDTDLIRNEIGTLRREDAIIGGSYFSNEPGNKSLENIGTRKTSIENTKTLKKSMQMLLPSSNSVENDESDDVDMDKATSELLNIDVGADGKILDGNIQRSDSKESVLSSTADYRITDFPETFPEAENSEEANASKKSFSSRLFSRKNPFSELVLNSTLQQALLFDSSSPMKKKSSRATLSDAFTKITDTASNISTGNRKTGENRSKTLNNIPTKLTAKLSDILIKSAHTSPDSPITLSDTLAKLSDSTTESVPVKNTKLSFTTVKDSDETAPKLSDETEKPSDVTANSAETMSSTIKKANLSPIFDRNTSFSGKNVAHARSYSNSESQLLHEMFTNKKRNHKGKIGSKTKLENRRKKSNIEKHRSKKHKVPHKKNMKRFTLAKNEIKHFKRDSTDNGFAGAISYTDAQGRELTYTLSKDKLTYDDARRRCLRHHHGDLVSISDGKEQEFVANNVMLEPSEYWIGLDDQKTEGTFEWVDGTPYSYTNWSNMEPDDGTLAGTDEAKNEDCAIMKPTQDWNDVKCSAKHRFICKATTDDSVIHKPVFSDGVANVTRLLDSPKKEIEAVYNNKSLESKSTPQISETQDVSTPKDLSALSSFNSQATETKSLENSLERPVTYNDPVSRHISPKSTTGMVNNMFSGLKDNQSLTVPQNHTSKTMPVAVNTDSQSGTSPIVSQIMIPEIRPISGDDNVIPGGNGGISLITDNGKNVESVTGTLNAANKEQLTEDAMKPLSLKSVKPTSPSSSQLKKLEREALVETLDRQRLMQQQQHQLHLEYVQQQLLLQQQQRQHLQQPRKQTSATSTTPDLDMFGIKSSNSVSRNSDFTQANVNKPDSVLHTSNSRDLSQQQKIVNHDSKFTPDEENVHEICKQTCRDHAMSTCKRGCGKALLAMSPVEFFDVLLKSTETRKESNQHGTISSHENRQQVTAAATAASKTLTTKQKLRDAAALAITNKMVESIKAKLTGRYKDLLDKSGYENGAAFTHFIGPYGVTYNPTNDIETIQETSSLVNKQSIVEPPRISTVHTTEPSARESLPNIEADDRIYMKNNQAHTTDNLVDTESAMSDPQHVDVDFMGKTDQNQPNNENNEPKVELKSEYGPNILSQEHGINKPGTQPVLSKMPEQASNNFGFQGNTIGNGFQFSINKNNPTSPIERLKNGDQNLYGNEAPYYVNDGSAAGKFLQGNEAAYHNSRNEDSLGESPYMRESEPPNSKPSPFFNGDNQGEHFYDEDNQRERVYDRFNQKPFYNGDNQQESIYDRDNNHFEKPIEMQSENIPDTLPPGNNMELLGPNESPVPTYKGIYRHLSQNVFEKHEIADAPGNAGNRNFKNGLLEVDWKGNNDSAKNRHLKKALSVAPKGNKNSVKNRHLKKALSVDLKGNKDSVKHRHLKKDFSVDKNNDIANDLMAERSGSSKENKLQRYVKLLGKSHKTQLQQYLSSQRHNNKTKHSKFQNSKFSKQKNLKSNGDLNQSEFTDSADQPMALHLNENNDNNSDQSGDFELLDPMKSQNRNSGSKNSLKQPITDDENKPPIKDQQNLNKLKSTLLTYRDFLHTFMKTSLKKQLH